MVAVLAAPPNSTTSPSDTTGKPDFIDMSGPPVNGSQMGAGPLPKINVLLIHYTQGTQEGADLAHEFLTDGRGAGIEFNIGQTGKVYQYFPLNNMQFTWQAYEISRHAIGIEITGADGEALLNNTQQFNSVVQTAKYLCSYYKIPCSDPKGDITNTSEPDSQGMLGHDEAPGNDHSDPDTKVTYNGGSETDINISTGKVWTTADRHDSSIHAYMIKLRKAMGFNPTPGSSNSSSAGSGSTSSSGSSGTCPAPTSGVGGYKNPFRDVKNLRPDRVDEGVDYGGNGPVYAIGKGKVDGIFYNFYAGEPYIAYTLNGNGGAADGKTVYLAENVTPKVKQGDIVDSNTVIATMSGGIETGWADPNRLPNTMAHDVWVGNDSSSNYTAFGKNFNQFLVKLGSPSGSYGSNELGTLPSGWPTW